MNYYAPYYNMYPNTLAPMADTQSSTGFFSRMFHKFNFESILTNTQKTLSVVNQAIPVIKQVSPVIKNAKTMFRVMNEFKRADASDEIKSTITPADVKDVGANREIQDISTKYTSSGGPTFFIN